MKKYFVLVLVFSIFSVLWLIKLFSENGINLNSSHQKDNFLITTTSHSIDNFNNNNLNNLNSYAKSTTITSTNAPTNQLSSPNGHRQQRQSPTSFEHQLRIFIPNYDNLFDNGRGQQPHSSRAGGSGMSADRRNMMGDRRMNSSMMDRQMVKFNGFKTFELWINRFPLNIESLRFIIVVSPQFWHDGQSIIGRA